jgi:phage tail sheath protein FI
MSFLHGVESQQLSKQGKTITVVKTAVIALVGTAPKGPLNQLTLVTNAEAAKEFGSMLSGFTIPQALDAIFKQGTGTVCYNCNYSGNKRATRYRKTQN